MNLFNSIFNTHKQACASKALQVFDYDDNFVSITMQIKSAKDYNDVKKVVSSIDKFKQTFKSNSKIFEDTEALYNRIETRFSMLAQAGL